MLPEPIVEHIKNTVIKEYEFDDRRIHVTELCSCLLKAYLRRKVQVDRDFEQLWYLYRGTVYDNLWTTLFPRNQVRVTHRIKNGPTIVGRIDFIHNNTLYELKTINTVKYIAEPYNHHVKQVKFYAFCENLDKAIILYVSFDGHVAFEIDCSDSQVFPVVEEFEKKAVTLYNALKDNIPPEPDCEDWECKYCEFFAKYCGGKGVGYLDGW